MYKKLFFALSLLMVVSMALAACQPAPVAEPEKIIETVVVEKEVQYNKNTDSSNLLVGVLRIGTNF